MWILGGNKRSACPGNFLFVDTESWIDNVGASDKRLRLRLWGACGARVGKNGRSSTSWEWGRTASEFWNFFKSRISPGKPLWVFAHNAAHDFTHLRLWDQFDAKSLQYRKPRKRKDGQPDRRASSAAVEGLPWFVKCEAGARNTVWFADSMNYWQCSLEELGDSVGLQKLKVDFAAVDDAELIRYCWRDVEIIMRAILGLVDFVRTEDVGNWRVSAAGMSLQNFKHWVCDERESEVRGFRRRSITVDNGFPHISTERDALMGGRIEAFWIGKETGAFYKLDVNSLYPSVMRDNAFPTARLATWTEPSQALSYALWRPHQCISTVRINSTRERFPVRCGGRQLHAVGDFWTTLAGPELARAVRTGSVRAAHVTIMYHLEPLFNEWVDFWYNARQKWNSSGDTVRAQFAKLIMNSLYGKFAQRGVAWPDAPDLPAFVRNGEPLKWGHWLRSEPETNGVFEVRAFAGAVQVKKEGDLPGHYFPAISSFVASYARERMRELIDRCPPQSVRYIGVDGLIVDKRANWDLIESGEVDHSALGKLRPENTYGKLEIVSQGCYRLDDEWTACGLFGKKRIERDGRIVVEVWSHDSPFDARHDDSVTVREVAVACPESLPKGKLRADGWVDPPVLDSINASKLTDPLEVIKWQNEKAAPVASVAGR